eukprot:1552624-Alexandrium_andersonii.AAC.1
MREALKELFEQACVDVPACFRLAVRASPGSPCSCLRVGAGAAAARVHVHLHARALARGTRP